MSRELNKNLRRPDQGAGYKRMRDRLGRANYEKMLADTLRQQEEALKKANSNSPLRSTLREGD